MLSQIMKPGILVHRQSKEMLATYLKNKEDIEGNEKSKIKDPEGAKKNSSKVMGLSPRRGSLDSVWW